MKHGGSVRILGGVYRVVKSSEVTDKGMSNIVNRYWCYYDTLFVGIVSYRILLFVKSNVCSDTIRPGKSRNTRVNTDTSRHPSLPETTITDPRECIESQSTSF